MHNEEETNDKVVNNPPKRAHGPNRIQEKPKDFGNAIKKLISYLHSFKIPLVIALILAAMGSIFSIVGPNKLSSLTDVITEGISVDNDAFSGVGEQISNGIDQNKISNLVSDLIDIKMDQNTITTILTSNELSYNDKDKFNEFLNKARSAISEKEIISLVINLPEPVQKFLLPSSDYEGVTITTEDKISLLNSFSLVNEDSTDQEMITVLTTMPLNISKIIFPEIEYDGVTISTVDQIAYLEKISNLGEDSTAESVYGIIDEMPESIKNIVEPSMNMSKINDICVFLLCLYLISSSFNLLQGIIMATIANKFAFNLREKISIKINKLPLKYFDGHSYGDILSRVTNDVDTVAQSMSQGVGPLVSAVTLFVGCIIMMFTTNWIMAITAILSSLFGFMFMFTILGKSQKYFTARQKELGKLNGHIEEIYSSHNVVKAYNGEEEALKEFNKYNDLVYECNLKSQFLSGLMQPLMGFIGNFGYVAVCVVGAILVMNDTISFGVIVAFMVYVRLFTNPLSQIAQGMTQMQTTAAASERVFEFLEEKEMADETNISGHMDLNNIKGNIEFKHVKFGYNDDKIIIKDFSCAVKPGEKIAIVGPTGAGKTTMVNLLMKFYDINSGSIIIDGVDISNLTREQIHDLFIMVLQDTWLFNGTIRDNIKYNKENVSDEDIWSALEVVGADHFVRSLPNTLDYEITDSDSISAGQKQLLTIARGMIEDSPFLILDEATSSVDTRTEELVQQAMDKLTDGRTSFIIAHRLSTIKNADLILVMNEGNIIEQGNHKELMKKKGFYADLYNSQFKK